MSSLDTKSGTFGGNIYENMYHVKHLRFSLMNPVLSRGGRPQGLGVANIVLKYLGFNELDQYFNVTPNFGPMCNAETEHSKHMLMHRNYTKFKTDRSSPRCELNH